MNMAARRDSFVAKDTMRFPLNTGRFREDLVEQLQRLAGRLPDNTPQARNFGAIDCSDPLALLIVRDEGRAENYLTWLKFVAIKLHLS